MWTQIPADEELGSSTCRSKHPRPTSTAGIVRQQPLRREDWSASFETGSGSGTTSSCTIRSGTSTTPPRRAARHQRQRPSRSRPLALPSKLAGLYVFDRVTGRRCGRSKNAGAGVRHPRGSCRRRSRFDQAAGLRAQLPQGAGRSDRLHPELRAQALERLKKKYKYEAVPFAPPILGNVNGRCMGRRRLDPTTNWPGSAADPETRVAYLQAGNMAVSARSLVAPPKGFSDIATSSGIAGQEFREVMGRRTAARPTRRLVRRSSRGPAASAGRTATDPRPASRSRDCRW